ncbi:MAG: GlsB/YeaQ/YmgE family stress response membrane protein [Verrucomicrobia bacterium]|nr:GlsB/YeaQ/YmgE family stress response membrane protein [Verrucomicrobiota bacterium]
MQLDPQFLAILNSVSPFAKGIIGTFIVGLLAGAIARFLVPGRDAMGCLMTSVLGIAGAFVALFAGKALGFYQPGDVTGFIGSVIGSIILLLIFRMTR